MPFPSKKIWYSFYNRNDYDGTEPFFFDTALLPWVKTIEDNYHIIKQDFEKLIMEEEHLKAYFNATMVNKKSSWKTFSLSWWNVQLHSQQKKCKATSALLKKIPNLVSASFNLLEPGSEILPHCGDTNAIYRCHLGLTVPASVPDCGFKAGNEARSWKEGETLVFCDAHKHTAWNYSGSPRYILLFDVIREEFISEKKMICANVLCSLFLQKQTMYFPFLIKLPLKIQFIIHYLLRYIVLCYVPCRNIITQITR